TTVAHAVIGSTADATLGEPGFAKPKELVHPVDVQVLHWINAAAMLCGDRLRNLWPLRRPEMSRSRSSVPGIDAELLAKDTAKLDRKSTRLNSSHVSISYA